MFLSSLMALAAVLIMGVISPGPSFIYVARNAVARSRTHGLVTALGTGAGAAIFSIMAMLGLQKVLTAMPEMFIGLKVAGGLYLLWLGYKIYRGAAQPMDFAAGGMAAEHSLLKTFRDGLYTQLSNPKTALVFASIFTALLPERIPLAFYYIVPLMSFVIDVSWYSLVALVLSSARPRGVYLRMKRKIDIVTATVLGALGLRLIATSLSK
ncbi:LysE family transporter [Klebsiella grimontii]|uniref:LysE family translocator n=1 Tax=Klebsiella grimontii TaxID=2058152 RepID=UPI0012B81B9B|nr:LysE family transporter [Klebsiella grimontii]MBZ7124068.1 LysE family translocator [Klebsiella grimontii]MBZ7338858.1 LysE family translocator [Klebsiella grimontii]MBZ7396133.1 LysE family translocator [Klebsiella grimontii]MDU3810216.1 LysE family transporter [Klebsiella grimontii]QLT09256.1 LysE family transporter [Klebsiella grimontii]